MPSLAWNEAQLWFLLQSEQGEVARDIAARATRVESSAKGRCPVDTGRLRASIRWTMMPGPAAIIGTDVEYAIYVHNGTRYMEGRPFLRDALEAAV